VNAVHLAYAILGGFVCVFSLISLFIKEKLYIGEASTTPFSPPLPLPPNNPFIHKPYPCGADCVQR
jgi:hypothetical protein